MVHSVADHVRQRFRQLINDRFVNFGVFTFGHQANCFASDVRYIANDTRHALENRLHRLRADRHNTVLDFPGQLLQFIQAHVHRRFAVIVIFNDTLRQHRLIDDEFANEVDQTINTVEIHADRGTSSGGTTGSSLLGSSLRSGGGFGVSGLACRSGGVDNIGSGARGCNCVFNIRTALFVAVVDRHNRLFVQRTHIERDWLHRQIFVCRRGFIVRLDRLHVKFAIPFRKFENLANAFFALFGLDRNLPGEVRCLRIHLIQ